MSIGHLYILLQIDMCTFTFIAALFTRYGSNLNAINWRMDKEDVVHIYNEILAIKKLNRAICYYMDGARGYYAKWSTCKSNRKNKYHDFYLYVESQKQNKWTNKTEITS